MTAPYEDEDEGGKNPDAEGKRKCGTRGGLSLIEIDRNSYDYLSGRYS